MPWDPRPRHPARLVALDGQARGPREPRAFSGISSPAWPSEVSVSSRRPGIRRPDDWTPEFQRPTTRLAPRRATRPVTAWSRRTRPRRFPPRATELVQALAFPACARVLHDHLMARVPTSARAPTMHFRAPLGCTCASTGATLAAIRARLSIARVSQAARAELAFPRELHAALPQWRRPGGESIAAGAHLATKRSVRRQSRSLRPPPIIHARGCSASSSISSPTISTGPLRRPRNA